MILYDAKNQEHGAKVITKFVLTNMKNVHVSQDWILELTDIDGLRWSIRVGTYEDLDLVLSYTSIDPLNDKRIKY